MPKTTTTKPPRDLLTLRAIDGRRVQIQARQIRAVTPSPTDAGHAHVELFKGGLNLAKAQILSRSSEEVVPEAEAAPFSSR